MEDGHCVAAGQLAHEMYQNMGLMPEDEDQQVDLPLRGVDHK